jgi:hypothetical protein
MDVSDNSETDNEKRSFARHIRLKHRLKPRGSPVPGLDSTELLVHTWQIVDQMLFARLEGRQPHFQTNHDYDFGFWGHEDYLALVDFKHLDGKIARRNFRQRQHGKKYADQDKRWINDEGPEVKWLNPPFRVPEWDRKPQHLKFISDSFMFPVLKSTVEASNLMGNGVFNTGYYSDNDEIISNGEVECMARGEDRKTVDNMQIEVKAESESGENNEDEGEEHTHWPPNSVAGATAVARPAPSQISSDPDDADGEESTDDESPFKRYWRTTQIGRREHNIDRRIRRKFGQGLTRTEWVLHRERVDTEGTRFLRMIRAQN